MQLKTAAPKAAKVLADLVDNAESERVKLEAAKAVLDRAGYTAEAASRTTAQANGVIVTINFSRPAQDDPLEGEAVVVK